MNVKITWQDIVEVAGTLDIDPCALNAVCIVESNNDGFLLDGRPKILFEAHIFWKELKKVGIDPYQYGEEYHGILSPAWNSTSPAFLKEENQIYKPARKLYLGKEKEYDRLDLAMTIHKEAALKSASWGNFQIMGFNHKACGFDSVFEFVASMESSPVDQLRVFCNFVNSANLVRHMKSLNWDKFAAGYNGSDYAVNNYHVKLANEYNKCKRVNG